MPGGVGSLHVVLAPQRDHNNTWGQTAGSWQWAVAVVVVVVVDSS